IFFDSLMGFVGAMLLAQLFVFMIALAAIYWFRQRQLDSLRTQELYLRRLAEGVEIWRNAVGVPADARQAVEVLVETPISQTLTRNLARSIWRYQGEPNLQNNMFWVARQQLDKEQRE